MELAENARLQTELAALKVVYQKVKVDRDHLLSKLEDAEEEMRFEQNYLYAINYESEWYSLIL